MSIAALARIFLIVALGLTTTTAWSAAIPKPSSKDKRIGTIQFDPSDVTAVPVSIGVVTHIVLGDDEEYITHAFGDAAAYDFNQVGKHLVLKPIAYNADSNLIVITDRRNYAFDLQHSSNVTDKKTFRIDHNYPEIDRAKNLANENLTRIDQALTQTDLAINWQGYSMSGDASLAPVNAWDDGAQTWLRFKPDQDLPAVYFVDANGNEVIPNRHMADAHTIVLHRTAALWHLRLGDQVLAVHNENSNQARSLSTGTISPEVERVLRQEATQ